MKHLKKIQALLLLVLACSIFITSCSKAPQTEEDKREKETTTPHTSVTFPYTEVLKAADVADFTVSDFVDPKGRPKGKSDEKVAEEASPLENSNWFSSPSISRYLARATQTDISTLNSREYNQQYRKNRSPFTSFGSKDEMATEPDDQEDEMPTESNAQEATAAVDFAPDSAESETSVSTQNKESEVEHSTTNVQVEGIDEAEIIKTDGNHIYYMSRRSGISIITAERTPQRVMTLVPGEDTFGYPLDYQNLYISGDNLVVIANSYTPSLLQEVSGIEAPQNESTVIFVYDISDAKNTTLKRTVEVSGQLNTTRLNNNRIYFVTQATYLPPKSSDSILTVMPSFKDSVLGEDTYLLSPENIYMLTTKNRLWYDYSLIGSFDLATDKPVVTSAYEGEVRGVYMNQEALYLASGKVEYYNGTSEEYIQPARGLDFQVLPESETPENDTYFNRFVVSNKGVIFDNMGIAPGAIVNQYAMDEFQKTFRVATTHSGGGWRKTNSLTVFDSNTMTKKGELTDLAAGEDIKSVRFTGTTAYVVTFMQVDPLFVIDLRNPTKPVIDGELKIPGFSTYLHPIGDNLLIGIGRDQEVVTRQFPSEEGIGDMEDSSEIRREFQEFGATQGVKVSMFDVSNPKRPTEIQSFVLGNASANSEALTNPKAIMFDLKKNIMAFPLDYLKEGSIPWNGGVVLRFSREGFDLASEIALDDFYGDGSRFVYIGDMLFYVCENDLVVIDYNTYEVLGQIDITL